MKCPGRKSNCDWPGLRCQAGKLETIPPSLPSQPASVAVSRCLSCFAQCTAVRASSPSCRLFTGLLPVATALEHVIEKTLQPALSCKLQCWVMYPLPKPGFPQFNVESVQAKLPIL